MVCSVLQGTIIQTLEHQWWCCVVPSTFSRQKRNQDAIFFKQSTFFLLSIFPFSPFFSDFSDFPFSPIFHILQFSIFSNFHKIQRRQMRKELQLCMLLCFYSCQNQDRQQWPASIVLVLLSDSVRWYFRFALIIFPWSVDFCSKPPPVTKNTTVGMLPFRRIR